MPPPTSVSVNTLRKYVEEIEKYQAAGTGPLWFRGAGKASYKLVPSLFRHSGTTVPAEFAKLEFKLVEMFRQRSVIYGTRHLDNEWERLFFMQHYGVPTRLLDWTESPFIAFFFAVTSASKDATGAFADDAAVWVLDPGAWNQKSLSHITFTDGILSLGDDALKGHAFRPGYSGMVNRPVCMFGVHNSQRIINQRGVFAVYGQGVDPMEVAYDTDGFPADCLRKIVLPKAKIADFRKAIVAWGITDSVVYPDLSGLAQEIRRFHGFEG